MLLLSRKDKRHQNAFKKSWRQKRKQQHFTEVFAVYFHIPKHGRLHNLLSKLFIMCPRHLVISREKNVTLAINFVFLLQKENTISYR